MRLKGTRHLLLKQLRPPSDFPQLQLSVKLFGELLKGTIHKTRNKEPKHLFFISDVVITTFLLFAYFDVVL